MADTRGNFAAATAQLRPYLLSGANSDKDKFVRPWELFEKGFAAVSAQKGLLTAGQLASFDKITKARADLRRFTKRRSLSGNPRIGTRPSKFSSPRRRPVRSRFLICLTGRRVRRYPLRRPQDQPEKDARRRGIGGTREHFVPEAALWGLLAVGIGPAR